jgi:cytochrome c oxidase subunit 2
MRRSTTLFLSLVATSSLVLAACGDNDDTTSADMPMSNSDMGGGMGGGMGDGMGGGGAMNHGESSPVADGARRIEVTARSFEFDPDEITVTAGEDVAIVLTSTDLLHDFTIDELDAHVAAEPGDAAEGGLRADEPGRYTYYCTVTGHREAGMEGSLVVEAP